MVEPEPANLAVKAVAGLRAVVAVNARRRGRKVQPTTQSPPANSNKALVATDLELAFFVQVPTS